MANVTGDSGTDQLGFDPEELHRKYLAERDKRLRADGTSQYIDLSGDYQEFSDDPYVEPGFAREPVTREVDVVVVGGGWAGLSAAVHLRQTGVSDLLMIEQGGDYGGTWYWNRYPGIRCDIESYIYIPFLEEVGTMPTEKYAGGDEILEHARAIGRHYELYDRTLFQTQVTSLRWNQEAGRWDVATSRGDAIQARHVIVGAGPLHRPKLAGIPGIKSFKGKAFHSSRWDYEYTGGDSTGGLDKLADKRVAIIGTGASTIQILPHVAGVAPEVYVFQRTPSAVDIRANKPTDPAWYRGLTPGWQQQRKDNFVQIVTGLPFDEDLVNDRWTEVWGRFPVVGPEGFDPVALQMVDYQKMEEIRARIDEIVEDRETAEALKPWYNLFCKRPLYSDEYLSAYNEASVTLVDTDGRGVDAITETGVEFDGRNYEVDLIIYATGFQVGAYSHKAGGYELIGRDGLDLSDHWAEGVRTLHGIMTDGFPNFFIIGGLAQSGLSVNYPHTAYAQAAHVAAIVTRCLDEGIVEAEATTAAVNAWNATLIEKHVDRSQFELECTPGYFNNEGNITDHPSLFGGTFGEGAQAYIRVCDAWLESGFEQDLNLGTVDGSSER